LINSSPPVVLSADDLDPSAGRNESKQPDS